METKSEPKFKEERVTDYDFAFISGVCTSYTLYERDSYDEDEDEITIRIRAYPEVGRQEELLRIQTRNVCWQSERKRVQRVRTPDPLKGEKQ
jgi:hypothetical protein